MDGARFDRLTRRLGAAGSRRRLLAAAAALALGTTAAEGKAADAKGRQKRRDKRDGHRGHDRGAGHVVSPAKKKCKGGKVKCGKKCRDLTTDAANCGNCGHACDSGQRCVGSACTGACSGGQTSCGGSCVDTQTDSANCGRCGNPCGSGKSCQGGQCVTPTCGANELLCGGTCVPSVGVHPCCSQADCGGPTGSSNQIVCDETQRQCRCVAAGYGICLRTADGRGICGECCAGGAGSLNCHGDLGCNGQNFCTCPAGKSQCPGGANQCYQNPANADGTLDDPTVCGWPGTTACKDCTQGGEKPYVCCWLGDCVDASGLKPGFGGSTGTFCGGCAKCPAGQLCCNDGANGQPKCTVPVSGGFCPSADAG